MKMLNLGCGSRWNKEWTNIDFHSDCGAVMEYNLLKGIPFPDNAFDVVYHSNVIEHFSKSDAPRFLAECYRVLKPGGVLRVAYPDLEQIISHYVRLLHELKNGRSEYQDDYEWIMLELYDQTVRNHSGGEMLKYFIREKLPNEDFVLMRCGIEAKKLIEMGRKMSLPPP